MSPTVYAGQPSHVHVRDMSRGQARYIVNKRENVEAAWPVRATGVRKRFHGVDALRGVDLEVAPGEIHGLLGPNGAGKTTLLRVLFGLIRPDGGEVRLFGREHRAGGAAQALQGVAGFVDRPRYYPYLTARQTLLMLATMDGHGQHPDIDALLECVDLLPLAGRRLAGWSTGMLQRLGVAAALMRSPRLLILDEPAEGLDPAGARDLRDLLRALSSSGVAILLSSHDMPEVEDICHTLTILNGGTVARRGSIEELRASSPAASHRITTSDDRRAARLALDHGLATEADAGVLLVTADPGQLDAFVCALGKADVAVRGINRGLDPLSALFFQLTETPPPTEPALSASP